MSYDKADWHLTANFPKDLEEEQIYVHTGFFIGWLIDKNLISDDFEDVNSDFIPQFKQRKISGPKLYELSGGVFTADDVNDKGRLFCNYYYEPNTYFKEYHDTFVKSGLFSKGLPSDYHVQGTWNNYNIICNVIDKKYEIWNNLPEIAKLKFKKSFDLQNLGINENHRAIDELFFEKYLLFFEKEGFKYHKTNKYFIRDNKQQKEIVGLKLHFRGGCGHTIFPYFAISNKKIEKFYSPYPKGIEYMDDKRKITIEYSPYKIEFENDKWVDTWSPQGVNSKVEPILEKVILFYKTEGTDFFKDKSFAKITELLLRQHQFETNHPYRPMFVLERVCKGLIASKMADNKDTVELIEEYRPFIHQHYSQGQWAYDKDAIEIFEKIRIAISS